jgi:hypothetical protein
MSHFGGGYDKQQHSFALFISLIAQTLPKPRK